ncbi:hypothetical protein BCR42DRAFT_456217 [Absidia repens]|uniref:HCP-like protein n=1 Tax=Absidia repens TaxID=90262 RepID=A0A1X2I268_9FUNG|nr:hypothetical protein BCR42DRAFT_456217 [Absidia repens]
MSVYCYNTSSHIVADSAALLIPATPKSTNGHDPVHETSYDSDDDTDQPLLQFQIANPDNLRCDNATTVSKPSQVKSNMDITESKTHGSTISTKAGIQQEKQQQQQTINSTKYDVNSRSLQLPRRQSKTLESDFSSLTTKRSHHNNTFHTIQETSGLQQQSSSACIVEPLITATNEKHQISPATTPPHEPPTVIDYVGGITTVDFSSKRLSTKDTISDNVSSASSSTKSPMIPTTTSSIGNRAHRSKYNRASYSLTNHPDALKLYRQMAEKTQDETVQLSYAKYLFEVAALYQTQPTASITINGKTEEKKKALEQEGVRWIRRLAKKGVGEAAFMQARWMETQQYGFKNTKQAHKIDRHYLVAVQAGVPEASYQLAVRQEATGQFPSQETCRLYQKSADLKCVQAIYRMAKIYLHGELGQHQHLVKGMNYLISAVNHATPECHEPPYVLALILSDKYSKLTVPSELLQTYGGVTNVQRYMEQAANLGNIGAKNRSGHIYEHGLYGAQMNMSKAFQFYQESVNKGQHLQSMLGLSRLYNGGCHGPNDNDEHLRLTNDVSGWLVSTPKDEDQSFYWCQRAAEDELPDALYLLGWYYEIGWGVPRNYPYSVECYQRAARKGQLDAMARLTNRNSFTRQQHEEVLGNRENVIQLYGNTDLRNRYVGRHSTDCILM